MGDAEMNLSNPQSRQGQRLLQIGVALFLFTSRGLCNSTLRIAYAWPFGALALRTIGRHAPRVRTRVAETQSREDGITDCFLASNLFGICDCGCVLVGCDVGSRQFYNAAGGRARAWECGSAFQEEIIWVVTYSSAPTGIVSFVMILWGLRIVNHQP